ncbi:MAG: transporter [Flavobacteriaceae bacterium]|nr:transporter [Flavobacteriaceae bacterium]
MKKLILLFIGILSMSISNAQGIQDALRYSEDEIRGTARYRAMSGAFGALGGDMSAVSINPAGSAIFSRSHASLTLSNESKDNDISFFNGFNSSSNSDFDLNQTGVVFVFNNTNTNSDWRKFVFGFAYDKIQNYDDDWFAFGTNNQSIDEYFLANAQGLRLDEISAFPGESISDAYLDIGEIFGYTHQQAFLGYESYILEPQSDTDDNTVYTSNVAPGSFEQDYTLASSGYNGKFSFNLATQYQDNIYLGLNLNSHFVNYDRLSYFYEGNNNVGSIVNEIGFENVLSTTGTGFSFQLGGIAKVSDRLRVGLTYNSPTWLRFQEETTQFISTLRDDGGIPTSATVDPQVVNIYPDYKIQTPGKITGSAALVFDQKGILSFDYSRKDYSNTKFKPESDAYFVAQNNILSNSLKAANSYKMGGEYRHGNFSFRGGYRFEESPYENTDIVGDLTGYSLGLGYSFGNTKLDLSFDQSQRESEYQFFDVGFTDAASLDTKNTNIMLSLGFTL